MKRRRPLRRTGFRRKKVHRSKRKPLKNYKRLKSVNTRKRAKRKAKYNAFMRSKKWKLIRADALQRSGNRCEAMRTFLQKSLDADGAEKWQEIEARCGATERLEVHHKTYARFGGNELPEDLMVMCHWCHEAHHAKNGKKVNFN